MTPREVAAQLGISPKTLRVFLRGKYGKLAASSETRWELTPTQVDAIWAHFASGPAPTASAVPVGSENIRPRNSPPVGDIWMQVLTAPRAQSGRLHSSDIPDSAGLYAWFREDECVYLGIAKDLRKRISTHRGKSSNLSRSTFRSWVAVTIHDLDRAHTRQRPSRMTNEQIAAVNEWISNCDVAWIIQPSREQAAALESALLEANRPLLNSK